MLEDFFKKTLNITQMHKNCQRGGGTWKSNIAPPPPPPRECSRLSVFGMCLFAGREPTGAQSRCVESHRELAVGGVGAAEMILPPKHSKRRAPEEDHRRNQARRHTRSLTRRERSSTRRAQPSTGMPNI